MYHLIYCKDSTRTARGWPTMCYSAPLQAPAYTGLNKPGEGITELLLAPFATCCQLTSVVQKIEVEKQMRQYNHAVQSDFILTHWKNTD